MNIENNSKLKGRVCEVQRNLYTIKYKTEELKAQLKGSFHNNDKEIPVIGDYVVFRYNAYGNSIIEEVCERKSAFTRPNMLGHAAGYVKTIKEQVLVANFDYVFIVVSLNQNYNFNRITRYVTVTLQGGEKPVVILTKVDLIDDPTPYIEEVSNISDEVDVVAISAITGTGMDQLQSYLKEGTTIAFLGSSGVGKSTLINTIAGEEIMKVSGIREQDGRGHHTTTHRQLLYLSNGVIVIDTPGIRELGMYNAEDGIEDTFSDITELITQCRFNNCSHQREPGCAIHKAIDDGRLSLSCWELYCNLLRENRWVKSKSIICRGK